MQKSKPNSSDSVAGSGQYISVVTETFPPEVNGVANTVKRFVDGLMARGHRVQVIRPKQRSDEGKVNGTAAEQFLVRGFPLPGYSDLRFGTPAVGRIKQLWREQKPDAVYVATEGPLGWAAVKSAESHSIPVVSGFHTNFHSYSGHYGLGFIKKPVFNYLRNFHNRTSATLVPTAAMQKSLHDDEFKNVHVVSRGVDTKLFSPARRSEELRKQWGLSSDDVAILYVGRVAPEKNLPLAIRCFRSMQLFDKRVRMVVVGDGPILKELRKKNPDIVFSGMQVGASLAEHYASADVLLFPSMTETFGNVILEGMASGLAVVSYNYAAAAEHIRNKTNGITAELGNEEAFVQSAMSLFECWREVDELRERARVHALANSWNKTLDTFEQIVTGLSNKEAST